MESKSVARAGPGVVVATGVALVAGVAVWRSPGAGPGSIGAGVGEGDLVRVAGIVLFSLVVWLAGSTVLYAVATVSRRARLVRAVGWVTLPVVRRAVERVLAVMLTVSSAVGGTGRAVLAEGPADDVWQGVILAAAAQPTDEDGMAPPIYVPTPAGDLGRDNAEVSVPVPTHTNLGPTQGPFNPMVPPIGSVFSEETIEISGVVDEISTDSAGYVVVRGDNLWVIAERHLGSVLQRQPQDWETARYWGHVIEQNRAGLRSGDPDLIFPGEELVLPALGEVTPELLEAP